MKSLTSILKKKENKKISTMLGLDIGSGSTKLCISDGKNIINTYEACISGVEFGMIVQPEIFEKDLKNILFKVAKENKPFPEKIIIGLNTFRQDSVIININSFTKRSDGVVTQNDIDELLIKAKDKLSHAKNLIVLHSIVTRFTLDENLILGDIVGQVGRRIELRILFILEDLNNKNNLDSAFSSIGLEVDQYVSGPLAESINTLTRKDMRLGSASVNIGLHNTSVVVYENNNPILCSVFKSGGENITSDLSLGLKLGYDEAEKIKIGENKTELGKRKTEEIIEARVNHINKKIDDQLMRIKRSGLLPAGIILSGLTSYLLKIDTYMRYDLKLPISVYDRNTTNSKFARAYGITLMNDESESKSVYIEYAKKMFSKIGNSIKKYLP
jgi:cell division protein FtsA